MTDSQTLLAEYAASGSEMAFRELITRYSGLVYSAALRLVGGDTHLAEDVAQTVFIDLARNARRLSREVMLGGWLHQRTFNVAAPMMRAQRRRQVREREAANMNKLQDDSSADLAQIGPILDEAITRLGAEDRTAIILRFFERRDFRSIGKALGSSEDAARMRVSRALDKLHVLLQHRGATLSAVALGTVLAGEAVAAAPAGVAMSVAANVLASSSGAGITTTLLKIGIMTKLKTGLVTAIVVAGVATSLLIQNQGRARVREQADMLQQRSHELARLTAENERLSGVVESNGSKNKLGDLLRLRAEAKSLRLQTAELAVLGEKNRQLQQAAAPKPPTPLQMREEVIGKVEFEKNWLLAFRIYALEHDKQFPTNFDQAAGHLPSEFKAENNVNPDRFEIVYQGPLPTNEHDLIAIREKETWPTSEGKLVKIYGMMDGTVQNLTLPIRWNSNGSEVIYDSFDAFEREHMVAPTGK